MLANKKGNRFTADKATSSGAGDDQSGGCTLAPPLPGRGLDENTLYALAGSVCESSIETGFQQVCVRLYGAHHWPAPNRRKPPVNGRTFTDPIRTDDLSGADQSDNARGGQKVATIAKWEIRRLPGTLFSTHCTFWRCTSTHEQKLRLACLCAVDWWIAGLPFAPIRLSCLYPSSPFPAHSWGSEFAVYRHPAPRGLARILHDPAKHTLKSFREAQTFVLHLAFQVVCSNSRIRETGRYQTHSKEALPGHHGCHHRCLVRCLSVFLPGSADLLIQGRCCCQRTRSGAPLFQEEPVCEG